MYIRYSATHDSVRTLFQSTSGSPGRLRIDSLDGLASENPSEAKRGGWSRRGGVDAESAMLLEVSVLLACQETYTRSVGDGHEIAPRGLLGKRVVRL